MRRLRVLHVIPSLAEADGGPSRAMLEIERGLSAAGLEVTTLTTVARRDGPLPPAPERVRRICLRRRAAFYKTAPGLVPLLPSLVRRHDVVHVHALFSFAPNLAALQARALRIPYVVRPLGTLARYGLAARRPALKRLSLACLEGPLLRGAAAVHFTSPAEQAEAEDLGIPMRGVVIPLGLPPAEAPSACPGLPAPAGRTVLLFLSRLDPKKNLEGLLDALAGSEAFGEAGLLLVAGDGPPAYVAALKARAAPLGDRIVWLGHVEGARKAALLAAADLFVLPSFSENFGIAAAEALAAGLPCLLGHGVALAGEVAQAGAGLAVAPDPASLRAALEDLLRSAPLRTGMGRRARALAAERYGAAAMTRRLVELYETVAAHRDGPR
ncbi:Glycosyltransferase involved in cell wall bisynthesis [Methylobacterium sp. 174MFSha1.1]|uniref:glycosyltransferase n=1 Tax=Methylobacterium sp. 174MFSha1.1 TaxID=1502749 RepID=UPI0008EE131B|nr:glycosyltransferase [Methylobacterium sp. 174MFSha1.1]SFU46872.1 Glycosyltransferase involved in cell wall bisynthesis [Methylobacterium sp. 174MFSha1.1]